MKFIHCSDFHLGAEPEAGRPWAAARKSEVWESVGKIIADCNRDNIDLLLIPGDLFHKQPPVKDLKILNSMFESLVNTRVVFICGNHDYLSPRSNYRSFKFCDKVLMIDSEELSEHYLYGLDTTVYGFSCSSADEGIEKLHGAKPKESPGLHILLAHAGADDAAADFAKLSEAGFDYIALGNRHRYECLAPNMYYAGSPEPLDRTETGDHGYIRGEFKMKNGEYELTTDFVPIAARRYIDLHIRVSREDNTSAIISAVTDEMLSQGAGNLYRIYLEGIRASGSSPDLNAIAGKGMITEVVDNTVLDYDYDELYEENRDNIIGHFMKSVNESAADDSLKDRILYYGIEALLAAKGVRQGKEQA